MAVVQPKKALALTAAHNLEHFATFDRRSPRHHPTTPREFVADGGRSVELTRTYPKAIVQADRERIAVASIARGWWSPRSDTAVVLLEIPDGTDVAFGPRLALDTRPPQPGEAVVAVGYRGMSAEFTAEPDYDKPEIRVQMASEIRSEPGKVVEHCPDGTGMYRFPGFLLDAPIHSGMSGGPVVSAGFVVRGIAAGDMSERPGDGAEGSGSRAFASAIWPTMGVRTEIELLGPDGAAQVVPNAPLLEWSRCGAIDDRGAVHQRLRVEAKADGTHDFTYFW